MNLLRTLAFCLCAFLMFGCSSQKSSDTAPAADPQMTPETEKPEVVELDEPTSEEVEKKEEVEVGPTEAIPNDPVHVGLGADTPLNLEPAPPAPEPFTRQRRRMNVDQLDASIRAATGGFAWTEGNKNRLEQLAATLGQPDYLSRVNEDLEPGPVFTKFLKDAAYAVCGDLKAHELEISADERILMVHVAPEDTIESQPEKVDENLRMLLLRFHGHYPAVDAPELEPWRWLFKSVTHLSDEPADGWRAVCVALIAHPDFYSY